MSEFKVDLKPIENLYLENIIDADKVLGAPVVQELFSGTDLYFVKETGELQTVVNGDIKKRSITAEADWIRAIKEGDANGDLELTIEETRKMIAAVYPEAEAAKIDPEAFLKGIQTTMDTRWIRLAKNMQQFQGDLAFKPTLDALEVYNYGIFLDDSRQARSVFPINGLTKTGTNILMFPTNIGRLFTKDRGLLPILSKDSYPDTWMLGDRLAENSAEGRYDGRKAALLELRTVIKKRIQENQAWAFEGNLDEAMKQLSEGAREVLSGPIPAKTIHGILMIQDDKQRGEALKSFATGERPSFLGYFGGNSAGSILPWNDWDVKNFWNYTGRHNNVYFARTVLAFLGTKFASGDEEYNERLHQESNAIRKDIMGDEGGFTNVISVVGTNVFCGFGAWCETTPYRSWGDEAEMDGLGRTINAGLAIYGTRWGIGAFKEAWGLRRLTGVRGVWQVWKAEGGLLPSWLGGTSKWVGGKGFRPIPRQAFKEARIAEEARLAEAGADVAQLKKGLVGKALGAIKNKLFGKLPPLPAGMQKSLEKAGQHGGKFMNKLVDGVIILYVTQNLDKKFEAYYNPFKTDHEWDGDPYPNVLKPDPQLYPILNKPKGQAVPAPDPAPVPADAPQE